MTNTTQQVTKYPRTVVETELTNKRNADFDLITITDKDRIDENQKYISSREAKIVKASELARKNFFSNRYYAMIIDALGAYCTDWVDNKATGLPTLKSMQEGVYYYAKFTRDQLEDLALGDLKKVPQIRRQLWDGIFDLALHPRGMAMRTANGGKFLGQPIIVNISYENKEQNRHGGVVSNLKGQEDDPLQVATIGIAFFRPWFQDLVESGTRWVQLPRHLQAKLEYKKLKCPDLFLFADWEPGVEGTKTWNLDTITLRKYFLYVASQTNNLGTLMRIPAIDFYSFVKPSEIFSRNGELRLRNWGRGKRAMEAFARIHSSLVRDGVLDGIRFTTNRCWFETSDQTMNLYISRKEPLKEQPEFQPSEDVPVIEEKTPIIPCDDTPVERVDDIVIDDFDKPSIYL